MSSNSTRALIVLTSTATMGDTDEPTGFWLSELTHPYYALSDAGLEVDIVSVQGGVAPVDPRSYDEDDPSNKRFMADKELSALLQGTRPLAEIDPADFGAIVFAGGHGTMWDFPTHSSVQDKAMAIYDAGGIVSAICHGPSALINLKTADGYLIEGRRVAGFTNEEERIVGLVEAMPFLLQDMLTERGADFQEAEPWSEQVVVDGRLVTGQNPQSAGAVGKKVAELLLGSL